MRRLRGGGGGRLYSCAVGAGRLTPRGRLRGVAGADVDAEDGCNLVSGLEDDCFSPLASASRLDDECDWGRDCFGAGFGGSPSLG